MTRIKTVVNDRFWIVEEDNGVKLGTLSVCDDRYMFSNQRETLFFDSENDLKNRFGNLKFTDKSEIQPTQEKHVYGYPTNCIPFQSVYDIKRKLPLFAKSESSKSYYCAGYFIIQFNKGWVKSFCPKLITVERYENQGPFKTEFEMKSALRIANGKS